MNINSYISTIKGNRVKGGGDSCKCLEISNQSKTPEV